MVTLKDIKISKTRIPLQNAIWLRPIGGLQFRVYYPHGGDWAELNLTGGGSIPTPSEDIEEKILSLEDNIQNLSKQVDSLETFAYKEVIRSISNTRAMITSLQTNINTLQTKVNELLENTDLSTISFTKIFPIDGTPETSLEDVGVSTLEKQALLDGKVQYATFPGYSTPFIVNKVIHRDPKPNEQYWLWIDMILTEGTKRTVFHITGTSEFLAGGPVQLEYHLWGEELTVNVDTIVLNGNIEKKSYSDITQEQLETLGLKQEDALGIVDNYEIKKVLLPQDSFEYKVLNRTGTRNELSQLVDFEFNIVGYEEIVNKTHSYIFSGVLEDESWTYNIVYNCLDGNRVP